jgi:hypothetical protein
VRHHCELGCRSLEIGSAMRGRKSVPLCRKAFPPSVMSLRIANTETYGERNICFSVLVLSGVSSGRKLITFYK